ncbi:MAG: leucine-rich repeat domain-containing protein [Anaerolineae bacterium]
MRDFFRRLFRNETVFIIVNTAFWIGLAALLLTDPLRLAVGAALLALALGGYLLYAGLSPKVTRGAAQPVLTRTWSAILGLAATVFAVSLLVWVFSGGVMSRGQARRQAVEEALARAAKGSTWLYLSDMGLREVPPEVWDLAHLTELDLRDNRLKVLPPDIARLTNLERLSLDGNRLEVLPPEIGQLAHLEWLDLDGNRLTTLPPEFARLQALTHLQLQYNRWETFPDVILELPNLELLFLAGNQLGELPQSITQRAEAGELDLWYKPNASRIDWSSIIVIGFGFVLPVVLSVVVDRWWTRREFAQRQAARQTGEVFAIPPQMRSPTLFVIFSLSAVSLFMLIAALNGPQTGVTMETGVGLCLLFSPLVFGGLIFLLHNSGMVVLTAEGVTLRRSLRRQFVRYANITAVTSQSRIFSPGILIEGDERTLRIPRMLENLPRCYTLLLQRVSPAVREASLGSTASPSAATVPAVSSMDGGPVYAFAVSRRVWALYIAGTVLLVLIYLGIGLLGIWTGLARGEIPPFNTVWVRNALIFFAMISVFFLPALIYVIYRLLTKYGPFKMEQPVAWEFYRDRIRYRFPRGDWEEQPASALQSLTLKPLRTRVRAVRGIETEVTLYMLVLEFADDTQGNPKILVIDQERTVQFGQTPERLHVMLTQLYGK